VHSSYISREAADKMWAQVRKVTGKVKCNHDVIKHVTPEQLNQHIADISTDPDYRPPDLKSTAHNPSHIFTEYHVFRMLDTPSPTAMGLDGLPAWFSWLAAPALSELLTRLFNLSLESSVVPSQWKSSYITPKPKLNQPRTPQDYRPISITPNTIKNHGEITSLFSTLLYT